MKKIKKQPTYISTSELSLLLGGLFVFICVFYFGKKKVTNEQTASHEITSVEKNVDEIAIANRTPARIKISKTEKPVIRTRQNSNPQKKNVLKNAEECILSKKCDFPNTDPRSYNLAAYKNLAFEITHRRNSVLKNWNEDFKNDFKRYFKYHDGFVKQAALETILKLDYRDSIEFVDSVVEDIILDHNTQLMDPTLDYIQNLQDPSQRLKVESAWLEAMLNGSPNKSEALAQYSHHLINAGSFNRFKKLLDKLPKGSPERTHLESSLREFEMTQTGG